jgi:hypothetical protein
MRRMMLKLLEAFERGVEPYAAQHPSLYRVQPLDVESDHGDLQEVLDEYQEEALIPA